MKNYATTQRTRNRMSFLSGKLPLDFSASKRKELLSLEASIATSIEVAKKQGKEFEEFVKIINKLEETLRIGLVRVELVRGEQQSDPDPLLDKQRTVKKGLFGRSFYDDTKIIKGYNVTGRVFTKRSGNELIGNVSYEAYIYDFITGEAIKLTDLLKQLHDFYIYALEAEANEVFSVKVDNGLNYYQSLLLSTLSKWDKSFVGDVLKAAPTQLAD